MKIFKYLCILFAVFIVFLIYENSDAIFQRGNPLTYLLSATKLGKNNPYVKVRDGIIISYVDNSEILEDFEKQMNLIFVEQGGSGYIFTDGVKKYIITSEIYLKIYKVWEIPAVNGRTFDVSGEENKLKYIY